MTEVSIYVPRPFRLQGDGAQRAAPRPVHSRQAGYDLAFDARTVFYDAIATENVIRFVAPPLLNLSPLLRLEVDNRSVKPRVVIGDRSTIVDVPVTSSASRIVAHVSDESETWDVKDLRSSAMDLSARRVLQTLSKDNEPGWIRDWATYYVQVHGSDTVVLYDNGSASYAVDSLVGALTAVQGLRKVIIVEWNFPYGPGGGERRMWDSDYCQHGSFAHSRSLITGPSRSLLNVDIDELVLPVLKLGAHAFAEMSPLGGVNIPGKWISSSPVLRHSGTPRHSDFGLQELDPRRRNSPAKWAIVPSRIPHSAQLRTHSLRGWWLPTIPGLSYRHLRGLTTSWRSNADGWGYGGVSSELKGRIPVGGRPDKRLLQVLRNVPGWSRP